MYKIKLLKPELFENLAEFNNGKTYIDLHNHFDCTQIKLDQHSLTLLFTALDPTSGIGSVKFTFKNIVVSKISDYLTNGNLFKLTVDNIYRGRFEKNGKLFEHSEKGLYYYYVDFYQDYSIELFASELSIVFN